MQVLLLCQKQYVSFCTAKRVAQICDNLSEVLSYKCLEKYKKDQDWQRVLGFLWAPFHFYLYTSWVVPKRLSQLACLWKLL